jgi:hypothetical protein
MCIGEQAVVADTTKAAGKNMKKKPTNEFCDLKSHDTAVVTSLPVMVLADEGNVRVVEVKQTAVHDGLSMPCQIGQDRPRPSAGLLAVNNPFRRAEGSKSARKHPGIIKFEEISKKPQLTRLKRCNQTIEKQSAETVGQHFMRQECRSARNPAFAVARNSSAGHEAVQVWMVAPTPTIP